MNKTTLSSALAAAVLALGTAAPTGANAQTATPEASPLTFNAAVFSEYRYRGISQTRFQPAVQAGADYAFPSGFYLGAWASTIKWIKDAKGGADVEIDLYGGYKGTLAEGLAYDVGALRYVYPSNGLKPSADTQEVYGAITAGAFTVKYSHATSNLFGFADSAGSGYLDVTASFDLGGGYMLAPHVGHQRVSGKGNGIYSYTDYSLTLSKDFSGVVPSITLIGTDAQAGSYVAPNGKQLGRSGVVVGLKYNF